MSFIGTKVVLFCQSFFQQTDYFCTMSKTYLKVETDLEAALKPYIISPAFPTILQMLERDHVRLDLSERKTATLGYFRPDISQYRPWTHGSNITTMQTISIQIHLNPYAMLFVLLHEWAHLITRKQYGKQASPHGKEWKKNFKQIAEPFLTPEIFPPDVLETIRNYFIKTGRFFDHNLQRACNRYGRNRREFITIYKQLKARGIDIPAPCLPGISIQDKITATPQYQPPQYQAPQYRAPLYQIHPEIEQKTISPSPSVSWQKTGSCMIKDLSIGKHIELEGNIYTIVEMKPPFAIAREIGTGNLSRLHFMIQVDTLERHGG